MTDHLELPNGTHPQPLYVRALQGGSIGFLLLILFFFGDGGPAEFGFRVYFPTLTTTIGGASGGIFYYLMDTYRQRGGGARVMANALSLLIFVMALWLSAVLGFAVTGDWD